MDLLSLTVTFKQRIKLMVHPKITRFAVRTAHPTRYGDRLLDKGDGGIAKGAYPDVICNNIHSIFSTHIWLLLIASITLNIHYRRLRRAHRESSTPGANHSICYIGNARVPAKLVDWVRYIKYYGDKQAPVFKRVLVDGVNTLW